MLYLDLDRFKAVNDSRGHLIGDKLLVQVGKRIRSTLREADIAARLGGDEFAIILTNNCDVDETAVLAQRLVETVSKRYEFDEDDVSIGVSIGIAIAPLNGTRPDQILRNADLALYRAKAEGRRHLSLLRDRRWIRTCAQRRMLDLELRQALQGRRVRAALPAAGFGRGQQARRVRGAGALEPSDPRHRARRRSSYRSPSRPA